MSFTRVFKTSAYELAAVYKVLLNVFKCLISVENVHFQGVFSLWLIHTESPLSNFSN